MPAPFTDEFFMSQALALARRAAGEDEVPVGALVVLGGRRIIGKGWNMTERLHDVSAHAEMLALTAAATAIGGKYLMECTLYVTLEPCPMCAAALGWAQLPTLVFGAADPKRGYRLFSPSLLHPKTVVREGVLAEACGSLLKDFFRGKR